MGRLLLAVLVAAALVPAATGATARYPGSIVVLGHSGATGFGSDPAHPYGDAPANSWATGSNPAVDSLYSRILAVNPAVRGHAVNFAQDGATLTELAAQIKRAVALKPKPELAVIQIGDDDILCDGNDASRLGDFRTGFAAALAELAQGLPQARILVVGSWGSFASYTRTLEGMPVGARLKHAGKGPCSIFAPASAASPGSLVPAHLAYLEKTVKGYEAQLAAACAAVAQCRYDGGAAARLAITAADLSVDLNHLSIPGQAKLAAAEWAAFSGFVR